MGSNQPLWLKRVEFGGNCWLLTPQNKLVIQGKSVAVQYSNRRQKFENWLCNSCGLYNFRKRVKCYRCGTGKTGDSSGENGLNLEPQQAAEVTGDTIILRNIAPTSTIEGILNILAPFANLSTSNVRLIKDKQTGQNRGFGFVQLSTPLEASQLLTILQSLQPPLKLDGNIVGVDFAKSARKDSVQTDVIRANVLSVASTAIAAAQWSSCQLPQSSRASASLPEGHAEQTQRAAHQVWPHQPVPVAGDGLLGAAPAVKTIIPAAAGVMVPHTHAHVYQPTVQTHPLMLQQQASQPSAGVGSAPLVAPASSTVDTAVCAGPSVNTVAVPDPSMYQYDESYGYYYDPQTGLYYDSSTQYYYNCETQQYLFWDSKTQTYAPAPSEPVSGANAPASSSTISAKEPKEKKLKFKNKSAQQIAKDMERWAKSLNKQKENLRNINQTFGSCKEEDRKGSLAADAAFSLFEREVDKIGGFEISGLIGEQVKLTEVDASTKSDADPACIGESDQEESGKERLADEEEKMTDWKKLLCLLCRRQFPTKEALLRHQQLSDLHKQNLEIQKSSKLSETELEDLERKEAELKYRDRAAERREKYGVPEPPAQKRKFYQASAPIVNYEQPTKDGLTNDNIGSKMLQAMGWQAGKGLGRHQQGITTPIAASLRAKGTGLGSRASSYELSPSDTYKDAVRKAMFARFTEIE